MDAEETLTIEKVRQFLKETPFELKPSQPKISFPKLKRFCGKIKNGIPFDPIQLSNNIRIIEGHHRFISSKIMKIDYKSNPYSENSNQDEFLWEKMEVEDMDYDSQETIEKYIKQDEIKKANSIRNDAIAQEISK